MGFRDDHEASLQRVEQLERDLAAAKSELEAALLRAVEVDDLRKRVVDLTHERDTLRIGVEPGWAARRNAIRVGAAFAIAVVVGAAFFAYTVVQRRMHTMAATRALAESQRDRADSALETTRQERDAARSELAQIDAAHETDTASLRRQLNSARIHEVGHALLVTAHVVSRSGNVPAGATDDCVLAIRPLDGTFCAASVTCGPTEVFPLVAPPDVVCRGWSDRPGRPLSLAHARAGVDSTPLALLEYDEATRSLEVRETAAGGFTMHLRVTDVLPYQLR